MVSRVQLIDFIDNLLNPGQFRDYCPNGLQIEGSHEVTKVITGVTVNSSLIEQAIKTQSQAIVVHHGLFWKGQSMPITGVRHKQIKPLLEHNINLIAYHLPLDAHPKIGNNAQLGAALGFKDIKFIDVDKQPGLFALGKLNHAVALEALCTQLNQTLGKEPIVLGDTSQPIEKVAWCTGGAQSYLPLAIEHGVDAYITGEYSLAMAELATEAQTPLIAAGHHATERGGVQALGDLIHRKLKVDVEFFDTEQQA